jgi:hypothetical protein
VGAATEAARGEVRALRDRVLPVIDALAASHRGDPGLQRAQSSIASLKGDLEEGAATQVLLAGHYRSNDTLAMSQGPRLPVHEHVQMQFATRLALASGFDTIARECRYVRDYLRTKVRVATTVGAVQPDGVSNSGPSGVCAVLLLAANPDKDLALDEEVRAIEENIRASEHRAHVKFLPRLAARSGDLLRAMNELRPAVVHFSGHGDQQTAIYLHDGVGGAKPVKGAALEMMFDATGYARVVVLASCYSAKQAKAIVKSVDCVIGMKRELGDDVARAFSGALVREGVDAAQVVLVRANADGASSRRTGA